MRSNNSDLSVCYVHLLYKNINGHSIFDHRLSDSVRVNNIDVMQVRCNVINWNTIKEMRKYKCLILSHYSTFKYLPFLIGRKVVLLHHDLPYLAYFNGAFADKIKGMFFFASLSISRYLVDANLFISQREAGSSSLPVIRVGSPPVSFQLISMGKKDIYLSGNYEWSLKKKSLLKFFSEYDNRYEILIEKNNASLLKLEGSIDSINLANEFSDLKIGLILDNFLSGFKLKSLDLIMRNCIVVSFSDITNEFSHIKNHERFVVYVESIEDFYRFVDNLIITEDFIKSFLKFKEEVLTSFSWDKSGKQLSNVSRGLL